MAIIAGPALIGMPAQRTLSTAQLSLCMSLCTALNINNLDTAFFELINIPRRDASVRDRARSSSAVIVEKSSLW